MKLILSGACGRMGRAVAELAKSDIVCGVDTLSAPLPFPLFANFENVPFCADAVIDFSSPGQLQSLLAFCKKRKTALVLGTTGFPDHELPRIKKYAEEIPIFASGNFSVGIQLMCRLAGQAAKILSDFDAEIVERHHGQKKDAPSGTALMLAESVAEGRGKGRFLYGRRGETCVRERDEIGIHAVRGGTIVGEHEVMFAGEDEIFTLSHSARSRTVFASGALRAAVWLLSRPAGLYHMDDLLSDLIQKG